MLLKRAEMSIPVVSRCPVSHPFSLFLPYAHRLFEILLFFGAWFQLFGLFWMVTVLPIFRPLPALMKLNTERALLD
jgi:hypothetical protein